MFGHLARSQPSGFRCLNYLGAESLLFQTQIIRFAEDRPGGCLRPNLVGKSSTDSQEFPEEIGCLYQNQMRSFRM
ncbi:hypothetical protein Y032_0050g2050 [Ancylostoma ceylanicum]|uniref:Uncharacterized protein n=1 Tax=Ancylostoma ceylanicum TaxID=53326 RepID=A0A016U8Q8_9BILA|nr:hypothetical protein Y032_0050g2050 [Ancylostoma ceylanicum]